MTRKASDQSTAQPEPKAPTEGTNTQKDPSEWTTGDEPMTGAQASYLKTLSEEANEPFSPSMSKGDASKRIDALRHETGKA